jgi:hypothetical protein
MKLFHGLKRSDYQDVLRALGHFIDSHGYTDVRIIETEDGLVLQGRVTERREIGESSYDTYLITDDDIKGMVREAFLRRGQKPPAYSE